MKIKATFSILCLVVLLLSVGVLNVHAASCTSYLSDYLSKVDAYNSAREAYERAQVAVSKNIFCRGRSCAYPVFLP